MKNFLREYWFYIFAPIVIVAVLLVALILMTSNEDSPPFIYNIF